LRDEIRRLEAHELGLDKPGMAPRLALAGPGGSGGPARARDKSGVKKSPKANPRRVAEA
jgi:excinuclease ABC subunit B